MAILITNNKIENLNIDECNKSNLFSIDRYYTWLNSQIDYRLRYGNRLCYLIISFLMRSNHYRHNSNAIIKQPIWLIIIDIIGWLAMIAFIVCLITGVATPIIDAIGKTINIGKGDNTISSVEEAWNKAFSNGGTITALVFTVITLIIGSFYLWIITKVIPKNKGLAIKDYVMKKVDYLNKFKYLITTEQKMNKQLDKAKEKLKLKNKIVDNIIFENADFLTDNDKWALLQINDVIFQYFHKFNIIIKFEDKDNILKENFKKIQSIDFKYINFVDEIDCKKEQEEKLQNIKNKKKIN